ncbi:MAG: hypothetical protein AAF518_12350 [Spirochaetota bacterium]
MNRSLKASFGFVLVVLLSSLLSSCVVEKETVSDDTVLALVLQNAQTSSELSALSAKTNPIELEGQVTVVDGTTGEVLSLFANVEENITGTIWSADYTSTAFPAGAAKTGSYFSTFLEWDNVTNVAITRRGTVCYGDYVGAVSSSTDGRCTGAGAAGISLSSVTIKSSSDDTTIVQSNVDIGYYIVTWSELNASSITYVCLVGPAKTYKEARTAAADSNILSTVSGSTSVCKDIAGRSSLPSTIDSQTNRFGYAPFPLKITN